MENVWHEKSKNAYHARNKVQQHYNGETYQLQIDSHHIFVKDWDTKLIKMLHKCDAGEYSVLTVYPPEYNYWEEGIWRSERMRYMEETKVSAMLLARFFENGYPAY